MLSSLTSAVLCMVVAGDVRQPPTLDDAMVSVAARLPSQIGGRWLLLPFNEPGCGQTLLGRQVTGVLKSALSDRRQVDLVWDVASAVLPAEAPPDSGTALDDHASLKAARNAGASVVVVGSLSRFDALWDVEVRLLRVKDGDTLFATPAVFVSSKVIEDAAGLLATSPERRCARVALPEKKSANRTLVGRWQGIGTQNSGVAWSMDVRIDKVTKGRCATVVYPRMYLASAGETLFWNWILDDNAASARLKRAAP